MTTARATETGTTMLPNTPDPAPPLAVGSTVGLGPTFLHARDGGAAYPADVVRTWPAHNRARFTAPLYDQAALDAGLGITATKDKDMRTENLVREMAHTWVDGGGDEEGIIYCLHQLRQAVRDEIELRDEAERARLELNDRMPYPA